MMPHPKVPPGKKMLRLSTGDRHDKKCQRLPESVRVLKEVLHIKQHLVEDADQRAMKWLDKLREFQHGTIRS